MSEVERRNVIRAVLVEVFADAVDVFGSPMGQYHNDAVFYNKVNEATERILLAALSADSDPRTARVRRDLHAEAIRGWSKAYLQVIRGEA